jgi:hypothetical protein
VKSRQGADISQRWGGGVVWIEGATFDHFELLIFNTELAENPQIRDTEDGPLSAGVIHVDSLDYQLHEPRVKPVSSVHSHMGNDIIRATGNAVFAIPGVLQPRGSRVCGVCACVNQLLLVGCKFQELVLPNCIEIVLEKYHFTYLPVRRGRERIGFGQVSF